MTSNEGIQASVYTRWHQLSVPLAFALAVGSFMLVVFNRGPIGLAAVLAVLGLLVPPLVAFKGFPTRNVVKVTPEGLEFSRRRPVAFAELSSWGTDDYLKLVRPGLPTLLVSAADLPRRERLLREFEQALAAWQKRQPAGTQAARRTHFYGSTGGRLVGLSITALGAVSAIMALNLREPSISLAVVGGLGALFGLAMLFGRRG
ncbi:hypothetical protein EUC41_23995 [Achromobacter denitrificans]|jgi:hypothetical protein|uniref:PH domain-containing protein n=1 Tax=Achromobacter denitrificans TaxID=32002 RepID=A0A427WQZ5_ACHDE|nr:MULTISPECIES: hypothetical protein [Achromobacter]MBV2158676.1 hypothetical protein [Achromobacter denitrificans]MDF3862203.1 hypothetical protein [Achromobacter denitrificans]MDX3878727.1 hypothetical protein [Achromobacter sp.]OLU08167.1 hypothetical protein BVK87_11420 [Achromobacter denitrificans]QCS63940.1 hypothetical protein EC609_16390 [Achromobacter denitrificans]